MKISFSRFVHECQRWHRLTHFFTHFSHSIPGLRLLPGALNSRLQPYFESESNSNPGIEWEKWVKSDRKRRWNRRYRPFWKWTVIGITDFDRFECNLCNCQVSNRAIRAIRAMLSVLSAIFSVFSWRKWSFWQSFWLFEWTIGRQETFQDGQRSWSGDGAVWLAWKKWEVWSSWKGGPSDLEVRWPTDNGPVWSPW